MSIETRKNITDLEASARTGMSRAWFQRKRWEGGGPAFIKMPGRAGRCLYPVDSLDAYFEGRLRTSTSDPGPAAKTLQAGTQAAKVTHIGKGIQTPAAGCSSAVEGTGGSI
jgi:hypothetical protein